MEFTVAVKDPWIKNHRKKFFAPYVIIGRGPRQTKSTAQKRSMLVWTNGRVRSMSAMNAAKMA